MCRKRRSRYVGNASQQEPRPSVSYADISLYYRESPSAFRAVSSQLSTLNCIIGCVSGTISARFFFGGADMKIRELIRFSKGLLEGRRARTIMICLLPLGAEMFFRCAEATVYCILLYFGEYDPIVLFSGRNALQLTTAAMCSLLRWVTAAPLMYCAAYRLYGMTAGSPKKKHEALSRVLFRKCTFKRSISAVLWTKVIGLLALAPAVFCGMTAFDLLHGKLGAQETFLAVNAVVLGVISVFLWLSLKLSLPSFSKLSSTSGLKR